MKKKWLYDESKHVGTNYSNSEISDDYNKQHEGFRDFRNETDDIIEKINLNSDSVVLDFGCGTGGISLNLAPICKKVICVDISQSMLNVLQKNADKENIINIETHCAGFLTYEHHSQPIDAIISKVALHHLPDFWKAIALQKMANILKPHGKFYLFDVAFEFEPQKYESNIDDWLQSMRKRAGNKIGDEAVSHIKDEFSTFTWILEELIRKAGFVIDSKKEESPNSFSYVCIKE